MESEKPVVSVIVPCYNSEKYIYETLQSVLLQTNTAWECIIMDDGSTDKSKEEIEKFTIQDRRFKYYYQANKGVANARNNAIKQSSGKYILPLDADDKIAPEYIAEAIAVLDKNEDIKVLYCKAELFGKQKSKWIIREYSFQDLLIENLIFCSAFFRKKDFDNTKGYNENMKEGFEDWDFWLSFLNSSDKVFKIPKVLFYYRKRESSRNTVLDIEKQKKLRQQIYFNHKHLYDKYLNTPEIIFELYETQNKLKTILNSSSYKIGKLILLPIRFFKNIFK